MGCCGCPCKVVHILFWQYIVNWRLLFLKILVMQTRRKNWLQKNRLKFSPFPDHVRSKKFFIIIWPQTRYFLYKMWMSRNFSLVFTSLWTLKEIWHTWGITRVKVDRPKKNARQTWQKNSSYTVVAKDQRQQPWSLSGFF